MSEHLSQSGSNSEKFPDPIPFDDFSCEKTNNFYLHFVPGAFGDMYRESPHYVAFMKRQPDVHTRLLAAFDFMNDKKSGETSFGASKKELDQAYAQAHRIIAAFNANKNELYQAYLIMRAAARNDWDVFR